MKILRHTESEAETRSFGRELADDLEPDAAVLLYGDLGTGKTVLAQGVAEGLGIEPGQVQSPSYTLIREHHSPRGPVIHVDLYRLEPTDLPGLGLEELLAGDGVKIVEWAERLDFAVPKALGLRIRRGPSKDKRVIETWVQ